MDILKPSTWFKTDEENDRAEARKISDDKAMQKRMAEIDFKYGHISKIEHDKRQATAKGEPWVKVLKMELDKEKPGSGFFELDFNEEFVEYLANSGYEGT